MAEEMSKILDYVGTLDELDTSGVPPMSHPLEQTNVFRDDDVEARIDRDDALAAAPDDDGEHVRAPKAIE
jgi:aspartyl-tRNA(Asn)/glutamyl-tRNA(Gln) amidotransferase subunit C